MKPFERRNATEREKIVRLSRVSQNDQGNRTFFGANRFTRYQLGRSKWKFKFLEIYHRELEIAAFKIILQRSREQESKLRRDLKVFWDFKLSSTDFSDSDRNHRFAFSPEMRNHYRLKALKPVLKVRALAQCLV